MFKSYLVLLFKQKTAYEVRISDWSSDVCSSDLGDPAIQGALTVQTDSGFYIGTRGTSLKGVGDFTIGDFGDAELDLYAGYGADLGLGTSVDAGQIGRASCRDRVCTSV